MVTLRFSAGGRVDQDLAAGLLDQHRVVGGGGDPLRVGVEGLAQRRRPEDLGGLGGPEVIAADGLGDGRAAPREVPFAGRGSRARFTVSVSGAAAITPSASGREASLATSSSISSARDQRPGRVVDRHQLGLDPLESGGHGLRAVLAAGDGHDALAQLGLVARRQRDDHGADALGPRERLERPLDQPPAGERDEGLRAAGSESLSGAGGRNDG